MKHPKTLSEGELGHYVTELRELLGDFRVTASEAHSLMKAMGVEQRRLREAIDEARTIVPDIIAEELALEVATQGEKFAEVTQAAIDESVATVQALFDRFAAIMDSKDKVGVRGIPDVTSMIAAAMNDKPFVKPIKLKECGPDCTCGDNVKLTPGGAKR